MTIPRPTRQQIPDEYDHMPDVDLVFEAALEHARKMGITFKIKSTPHDRDEETP